MINHFPKHLIRGKIRQAEVEEQVHKSKRGR